MRHRLLSFGTLANTDGFKSERIKADQMFQVGFLFIYFNKEIKRFSGYELLAGWSRTWIL